ncbi:dimethyl sulfoxide reductase anchor subunit family protein [Bacillus marasmi]|uniref:dimethyl sulfoxide reductase anchor subunit family protein n=1 Tax=Bacillus marasmi TaxID=1926279 RepID=UPI0011CA9D82|nr:DmsC/YnfH family molybdoenzyme membrane anchor subunit [Bacillus marasmi]
MHEWPLLIFTVAIPASVGGILFLSFIQGSLAKSGKDTVKVMKLPILVIAILSIIGLIGSFFHLGSPMSAINTLKGFGRSWMSNEIVFTGVFIALVCVMAGLVLINKKLNPVLLLVTGIVGLVTIYCMASAYAVTRVNGWDHLNTYLVFFGTTFSLGPVLGAGLLTATVKDEKAQKIIKWAFAFGIIGIAIQVAGSAMFAGYLPEVEMIDGSTAAMKLESYSTMIGIRWIIELAGLAAIGYLSVKSMPKTNYAMLYAAILVFAIAEGMSRYVFYVLGA